MMIKYLTGHQATRILLVAALFVFFAIIAGYNYAGKANEHTVVLEKSGFYPDKLVINRGDIVVFKTNKDKQFWPASNEHPSHTIDPDFDPKRALDPDESWSFKFKKEGSWKYHDHLNPFDKGVVMVEP